MDQRAAKRPQSDSKIPPKKKTKKSKSSKQHASVKDKDSHLHATNSLELTATAEGITMTQVMSTFNRNESSRFEAFRRSTFPSNAISNYVAHSLVASAERSHARNAKSRLYLGGKPDPRTANHCPYVKQQQQTKDAHDGNTRASASTDTAIPKRLSLSDVVATGQADEIAVVVSTLAKAYAQRLVTAANRVAASEGADDCSQQPLLPKHVLKAHDSRVKAGLDPGFFLQKSKVAPTTGAATASATTTASVVAVAEQNGLAAAAALGVVHRNTLQRHAALAAQEEYDKHVAAKAASEQEPKDDSATTSMDVDQSASETNEL